MEKSQTASSTLEKAVFPIWYRDIDETALMLNAESERLNKTSVANERILILFDPHNRLGFLSRYASAVVNLHSSAFRCVIA